MSDIPMFANRYQPIRVLGEGAMGLVWAVEDTTTGAHVALKVISTSYGATAKSILQFKQEFRLMTLLRHPNCCAVYDYGVLADGAPYFTMEEVEGHGLDELAPQSPDRVRQILAQLLLALGYVHQRGFVHRDLKGANVRVRPDGSVKLMDYGLMEYARRSGGAINGTPSYLAPEIITRGSVDQRGDLYAVGVLAYEMLTGRAPFVADAATDVLRAHLDTPPEPPSRHAPALEADPALEAIVLKLLAKNPLERFQSAHQVLEALGAEVPTGFGGNLLTSPLMGREPELARLTARLAAVAQGEPAPAIALHGPSGIGKSRLVEEFRYAVQLEGLPCVTGASHEHGNAPYDPFVAVLRSLMPALRAHAPEALAELAPVLVPLLPELGVAPAEPMDSPTKEKLRVQSAITGLFAALAERTGFVVVLEDWQWADDLSVQLLDYVLRNTAEKPILLALTSRTDPDAALHPRVEPLVVSHLDEPGVTRMVSAMLGTDEVAPRFLHQVGALSKGVPFFVEKLLEHLVQDLTITNVRGRWMTDVELPASRLPNNLKGLLMWRITCLSETAQLLAHVGAVVGRDFTIELLQGVSGVPETALFQAIEALAHHQVFIQNGEGVYQFAQDQIQELLYATIDPAEKRRWHSAIAARLASGWDAPALAPLELVNAVAHHAIAGEDAEAIIPWALEAGRRAAGLFANAEAEARLLVGLARVKAAPSGRFQRERMTYWRLLADVRRVTGRNADAKEAYQEAISLAGDLGEAFEMGRMLTYLGRCYQVLGDFPAALDSCRLAMDVTTSGRDTDGAARCLIQQGRIHYFMGNMAQAIAAAEEALALARACGNRGFEGEALGMLGYFYVASSPDKIPVGVENLHASVRILSALGDRIATVNSYNFLGTSQNMLGLHLDALESFTQNRRIAHEIGALDDETFAWLNLAITSFELGDFPEMAQMAASATAIAARLNSKFPLGMANTLHAVASVYLGDLAGQRERIEAAHALACELKHKYMQGQVLMYLVDVLLHLGALDAAAAQLTAWRALVDETGDKEPRARLLLAESELAARRGDLDAARGHAEQALDAVTASRAKGLEVRVLAKQAWLALRACDMHEAEDCAKRGIALAKQVGAQYQLGRLYLAEGAALLGTGAPGAEAAFEAAAALATSIGAVPLRAQALYGLAAAESVGAAERLAEARGHLSRLASALPPEAGAAFLALDDRHRVMTMPPLEYAQNQRGADGARGAGPIVSRSLWQI